MPLLLLLVGAGPAGPAVARTPAANLITRGLGRGRPRLVPTRGLGPPRRPAAPAGGIFQRRSFPGAPAGTRTAR
jgi:hypothetical protein